MRCAVDGCSPVCSLITFSDTGSWCEASTSSSAKARSSTWIVGVCGPGSALHAPILHREILVRALQADGSERAAAAIADCAPRPRASPGTGRRRSRRRRQPGATASGGRRKPGVQRKVARFSVARAPLQRRRAGRAASSRAPAPASPPRWPAMPRSTQGCAPLTTNASRPAWPPSWPWSNTNCAGRSCVGRAAQASAPAGGAWRCAGRP